MDLEHGSSEVFGKPVLLDFTEALFQRVVMEIERRRTISEEDRKAAALRTRELRDGLTKLRSISDDTIRMDTIDAVSAALWLGFYHQGDAAAAAEAVAIGKGVAPAKARAKKLDKAAGRNATEAKEIIWRLTKALWDADEYFRERPTLTAKRIYKDVAEKMSSVVEPSSNWAAPAKDDVERQRPYLSRIENYVKLFKQQYGKPPSSLCSR